jgi:hypothetical protein
MFFALAVSGPPAAYKSKPVILATVINTLAWVFNFSYLNNRAAPTLQRFDRRFPASDADQGPVSGPVPLHASATRELVATHAQRWTGTLVKALQLLQE